MKRATGNIFVFVFGFQRFRVIVHAKEDNTSFGLKDGTARR